MNNILLVVLLLSYHIHCHGKEKSRPQSIGGDHIYEVNLGSEKVKDHSYFELAFDYEYFIPGYNHHLSIGVATDLTFKSDILTYLGPLISYYSHHVKYFLTAGPANQAGHNKFKYKGGIGYEFFPEWTEFIIIPTMAYAKIGSEEAYTLSLGCAHEF